MSDSSVVRCPKCRTFFKERKRIHLRRVNPVWPDDELAYCGRLIDKVSLAQTPLFVTEDPEEATCGMCLKKAKTGKVWK